MPVPQVAIISNPGSTQNLERIGRIRRVVEMSRNIVNYELDDVTSIPKALETLAKTNPSVIAISGGDGTVQAVLGHLMNNSPFIKTPPIAILPSGKTNMIAVDLGFKGKPEKLLKKLIKVAQNGKLEKRLTDIPLIEVNFEADSKPLYGMFFGGAAIVNGILHCREKIYPMGLGNVASHALAISTLVGAAMGGPDSDNDALKTEPLQLEVNGDRYDGRYMALVVTTLDRLLLRAKPYGRKGNGGLGFSMIEHTPKSVLRAFFNLIIGRIGKADIKGVVAGRSDDMVLHGPNPFTLDGEIYSPDEGQKVHLKSSAPMTFVRF